MQQEKGEWEETFDSIQATEGLLRTKIRQSQPRSRLYPCRVRQVKHEPMQASIPLCCEVIDA